MIISRFPAGQPVTERAIPTPIFNTESKIRNYFLRKWSHDSSITDFDIRNFIDWDYYIDRFSNTIQKIITIPAGIQNIDNPIERVKEPDWLKRLMERNRSSANQSKISGFFSVSKIPAGMKSAKKAPISENEKPRESETAEIESPTENVETMETVETEKPRSSVKRNADFPAWLAQRKRQWQENRRFLLSTRSEVSSTPVSNSRGYYQILEIETTASGNESFLWGLNPPGKQPKHAVQIKNVLYNHSANSILFIAHDLSVVKYISDRVVVMYLGTIVEEAETEELYGNPSHPYTQALLSAIPEADPDKAKSNRRIAIKGEIPSPINPKNCCRFAERCQYATERCFQEMPQLREIAPGHRVACHLTEK